MNAMFVTALKSARQIFCEEGILFYPQIFEGEELARLLDACNFVLDQYLQEHDRLRPEKGNPNCMRQVHDSRWHRADGRHFQVLMETIADPRCLGPVEQIFRGRSLFRCTSLFFNPRLASLEGDWHRDHQFVLPDENAVKDYFAAKNQPGALSADSFEGVQFQIALVDNDDVEYVPFSAARYDSPEEYQIRCADKRAHKREAGMPNAMRVRQCAGDAIIFNAAGLHRGRYHTDRPRRTLMLTYSPRHLPFHDDLSRQPWMLHPDYLSGLSPRARAYFDDYISVYRDSWTESADKV